MQTSGNSAAANVSFISICKQIDHIGWLDQQISWSWQFFIILLKKQTWKPTCFYQFWANLRILILKLSDVRKKSDNNKKGLYKWDLVKFNHTSLNTNMTSIRDGLFFKTIWLKIFLINSSLKNLVLYFYSLSEPIILRNKQHLPSSLITTRSTPIWICTPRTLGGLNAKITVLVDDGGGSSSNAS